MLRLKQAILGLTLSLSFCPGASAEQSKRVYSGGGEGTEETGSRVSKRGEEPCVANEIDARRLQGTQQPERLYEERLQKDAQITPAKRELIKKLLIISEADKRARAVMDAMLAENEKIYAEVISKVVDQDPGLTPQQKKNIQSNLGESSRRFSERYRLLLPQKVNLPQVTEEVALKIYDKYFTESELNDLFTFYSTPTGQKAVQKMPELVQESIQVTSNIILPKLQTLIMELIEEEKQRWRNVPK